MSYEANLKQTATLTIHPPTGSDAEGNATFGVATTTTYPCFIQQLQGRGESSGSDELVYGETRTDTYFVLFLPASAATADFEDTVLVDGLRYQLEGQPDVVKTPRGIHHVEARLRRNAA